MHDNPDEDEQESGEILCNGGLHRTLEEIDEACAQVWDRRWYGAMDRETRLSHANSPEPLTRIAAACDRIRAEYGDVKDHKYYDQWGWGYLAGIHSALGWVLGESWAMLDL